MVYMLATSTIEKSETGDDSMSQSAMQRIRKKCVAGQRIGSSEVRW